MITLAHFLTLGAILFCIAIAGIFINRKNVIVLLMAIELMLLAVNTNFVAFSRYPRRSVRAGIRVLHPDCRRGGICNRPCDPCRAVPQPRDDQRGRTRFAEGLSAMQISKTILLTIVLAPLFGAIVAGLFGRRIGRAGAHTVTIAGVALSCALSFYVLYQLVWAGAPVFNQNVYTWFHIGNAGPHADISGERRIPDRSADRDDDGRGYVRVADGAHLHDRLHGRRPTVISASSAISRSSRFRC